LDEVPKEPTFQRSSSITHQERSPSEDMSTKGLQLHVGHVSYWLIELTCQLITSERL